MKNKDNREIKITNPKTMCLDDMVNLVAEKIGKNKSDSKETISKTEIREILISFRDSVIESVESGNSIYIVNGWSFDLVPTNEKELKNPKTGANIKIPASVKIRTKIANRFKEAAKRSIGVINKSKIKSSSKSEVSKSTTKHSSKTRS